MSEKNIEKNIIFSEEFIQAKSITNVENYKVEGSWIVVNPAMEPVAVDSGPVKGIEPKCSIILTNTYIKQASFLILLAVKKRRNMGNIIFEKGWGLYEGGTKKFQLWKSPQVEAGTLSFDPRYFCGQTPLEGKKEQFTVKVNLWFSPEKTDCGIHNEHDFIEIHTQVAGIGHMQKFKEDSFSTLYWDEIMAEGYTTFQPYCMCKTGTPSLEFEYPFHQYFAESDCIWMAIEYHVMNEQR